MKNPGSQHAPQTTQSEVCSGNRSTESCRSIERAAVLVTDSPHLTLEVIAGLADTRWRHGDEESAHTHINQFLDLQAHKSIEAFASPLLNYRWVADVLRELGEEQKAEVMLARRM